MIRTATGTTTYFIGDWREVNASTRVYTNFCPFNGQAVAIADASAREVASLALAFGGLRTLTYANGYSTLPTDRLFTGQTRDLADDRLYYC